MTPSKTRPNNTATMLHSIAEELGCDPELVGVVKKEHKLRSRADILHATQERLAEMAKQDAPSEPTTSEEPKPKKEKKAGLTLSQRRALLRLLDTEDVVVPATDFKALPYEKLVDVGYAVKGEPNDEGGRPMYSLTQSGHERATTINPGYRVWSSGETVAGDESRPVAGTHRQTKAEADAAKTAAEAKAAASEPDVEEQEPVTAEIGEPVDA